MYTSIDEWNDRVTSARIWTTSASLIGRWNETLFTAAVTHTRRLNRCALMAAVTSIQFNRFPPIKFPSVFVSFGITMRVV
jgi:hypothetical protein